MRSDHPLVPKHKSDLATAQAAVAAGYPRVAAILPDLLEWLQDCNWPVAHILFPFLATVGLPIAPHVRTVLESDDSIWQYWVIGIAIENRDVLEALRPELERIVTRPTSGELAVKVVERAEQALRTGPA